MSGSRASVFELKNGVRVLLIPRLGLRAVEIEVFLKMGSKYEREGEFGMSHFLEHMAFKGTKKRPESWDLMTEIDAKGAYYNASTDQEITSYYITTIAKNVDWAMELLSDVLLNSTYKEKEVKKERGVIVEEIRMYKDNAMAGLSGEMAEMLFGGKDKGCFNISGGVKDIRRVEREKLLYYRKKYFDPKKTVVAMAGDVKETDIKIAEKYFGGFKRESDTVLLKRKIILNKKRIKEKLKEREQEHFCLALPGLGWSDNRYEQIRLLELILAGNSSSRLFRKIREEKGWAYYVNSVGQKYEEAGFVAVQAGIQKRKADEALELVKREILAIGKDLRESELRVAKEYIMGTTRLAMDRTSFWTGFLGRRLLMEDRLVRVEEEIKKYEKVTVLMLKKLAKELFVEDEMRRIIIRSKKR